MRRLLAVCLLSLVACGEATGFPESLDIELVDTFDQPVNLVVDPEGGLWVVERGGRIVSIEGEVLLEIALNLEAEDASEESGLLGLAFHPDWPADPRGWVYWVWPENGIAKLVELEDGYPIRDTRTWDPAPWHYGGHLEVHDGRLYIGVGDGAGGAHTARAMAAQIGIDRGAILAWEIDTEQWHSVARGLRNPWTWTIHDDHLWIGDVGAQAWEEINVAPLDSQPNFGWPLYEGPDCISRNPDFCAIDHVEPVIQYPNPGCAAVILGGFWKGGLVWSDFCDGLLRYTSFAGNRPVETHVWDDELRRVTSITPTGESLYVASLTGEVLRISGDR